MMSLCNPKVQVLKKAIKKPNFNDENELITFNEDYKSPNIRVNIIPVPRKQEKKKEDQEQMDKN
jgi:hypothetical protein